jgi:addiction module HigA family antidote
MSDPKPRPIHPGEILREDFLPEYDLTPGTLAKALHVPRDRIEKLVRGQRAITADTAARLARYFGTTPQFWMNLQSNHDLAMVDEGKVAVVKARAAA